MLIKVLYVTKQDSSFPASNFMYPVLPTECVSINVRIHVQLQVNMELQLTMPKWPSPETLLFWTRMIP